MAVSGQIKYSVLGCPKESESLISLLLDMASEEDEIAEDMEDEFMKSPLLKLLKD